MLAIIFNRTSQRPSFVQGDFGDFTIFQASMFTAFFTAVIPIGIS